ncbi:23S rRNA (uracil(1939)-C(5))-methyltransferase RlmD [Clostridium sp. DL1XJH146]
MEKEKIFVKNEEYILDIIDQGYEGEGIAKVDRYPMFIKGAIEGEKVKVKCIKVNKNFAFGKLLEVIEASKKREEPVCPIYNKCGGCNLQHMNYEGQLEFKKNRVKDCLVKIGKIDEKALNEGILKDTIGMETPYRYRNKVQLPIRLNATGNTDIGFYLERSHDLINVEECFIQHEDADKIINITRLWINKYLIKPYNEQRHSGLLRHLVIRRGFKTGEIMIVLVTKMKKLPYVEEYISMINEELDNVVSVIHNINPNKGNKILGDDYKTLWGKDSIVDYIGQFKFNISAVAFFQVNPIQTEKLYNKAIEFAGLTGNEVVFDAYCGTGTITLFLAQKAKKVYGVEIIADAIEKAKINAEENSVDNCEFIVGKSEEIIPALLEEGIKPDVIVVDPPRKGCDKELLVAIGESLPQKIVYVSCDPSTLARDVNMLHEYGYAVEEVQPVDMFSQSSHVETVVRLVKH